MSDQHKYYLNCIDKSIALYWETLSKARGMKLCTGDIDYVISDMRNGPERIFNIQVQPENAETRINDIVANIMAGRIPDSFLITPNSSPHNLSEILSCKGFNINTSGLCMAMDLTEIKGYNQQLSRIKVIEVKEDAALKQWVDIINTALFECEIMSFEQFHDIYSLDNTRFYIGLYNGVPASACMTISEGNIADLDMVATLKEYRQQGLATAVIHKALLDLHDNGVKTVSLRAEPDGINLYIKIGFKEYCKRVVADCDWENVYRRFCQCCIESDKVEKANMIYKASSDISSFIEEMQNQGVIGQRIWLSEDKRTIFITKKYSSDCSSGCTDNDSLIGQRCHCHYFNHLKQYIPIRYCKCSAEFFRPMFEPIFGNKIVIEPVETVLSGGEKCTFAIRLNDIKI